MFLCKNLFSFRRLFPLGHMQKFTLLCNNLQYKLEQSNKNVYYLQKILYLREKDLIHCKTLYRKRVFIDTFSKLGEVHFLMKVNRSVR